MKRTFLSPRLVIPAIRTIVLILMFWALGATAQPTPAVNYRTDTVVLDFRDLVSPVFHMEMSEAVVLNGMAYCLLEEARDCAGWGTPSGYLVVIDLASGKKDIQRYRYQNSFYGAFELKDDVVVYYNTKDSVMATYNEGQWKYGKLPKRYLRETDKEDVRTLFRNDIYQVDYLDHGEWGYYSWVWHIPTNKHLLYPMGLFSPICLGDTLYMKNKSGIYSLEPNLIGRAKKGFCSAEKCRNEERWWFLYQFYGDPRKDDLETQEKKYQQLDETYKRNLSDTICHTLSIAKYPTWPWGDPADTTIYNLFALDGRLGAVACLYGEQQVVLVEGKQLTPLVRLGNMGQYCGFTHRLVDGSHNTLLFNKGKVESTILQIEGSNIHQMVIQQHQDTLAIRESDSFDTILAWLRQHHNDLTPEQIHLMETTHGSASDKMQWDTLDSGTLCRRYYQNLTKGLQNETTYHLDSAGRLKEVIWEFNPKDDLRYIDPKIWETYTQSVRKRITQSLGRGIDEEKGERSWWKKEGSYHFFEDYHRCRLTLKPKEK